MARGYSKCGAVRPNGYRAESCSKERGHLGNHWNRACGYWGRKPSKAPKVPTCRVCGCTDQDCQGCLEKTGFVCHWVEDDLCSACVTKVPVDAEVGTFRIPLSERTVQADLACFALGRSLKELGRFGQGLWGVRIDLQTGAVLRLEWEPSAQPLTPREKLGELRSERTRKNLERVERLAKTLRMGDRH